MSCLVALLLLSFVFAAVTVMMVKSTAHEPCVVIDIYGLDPDGVLIGPTTQIVGEFSIFAVFELPRSYKLKMLTVRLLSGFGVSDYEYKLHTLLLPAYKVGTPHTCMIRTFPNTKVMLEHKGGWMTPGYDNLVIGMAVASGGFLACALLVAFLEHSRINVNERVKSWVQRVY